MQRGYCIDTTIGTSAACIVVAPAGAAPPYRCRRPHHRLLRGGSGGRAGGDAAARLSRTTSTPMSMSCPCWRRQGCRVIVPYLRGYGPTRFRDPATPRSGEQASIGADLIALMDALSLKRAVFAGYDWGGRAACVGAALWPERCAGLVSVNGYLIQDIARAMTPAKPEREVPLWYQYYFQLERGRAGLAANRREYRPDTVAAMVAELAFRRRLLRADGCCARQSRLCRRRDPQLPPPLRPCRRRSALCRPPAPAGGAAGHCGPCHHARRRCRRRRTRNRRHRAGGEVFRPPHSIA